MDKRELNLHQLLRYSVSLASADKRDLAIKSSSFSLIIVRYVWLLSYSLFVRHASSPCKSIFIHVDLPVGKKARSRK